jgi:DNA-binding SARP family transcriptional activator
MQQQLQCNLFGTPELCWGAQPVSINRRQPRALLYRLCADLRPIARSQLCYLFWPDLPETTARRNLTRLLVLLRGALPHPALLLTEEKV